MKFDISQAENSNLQNIGGTIALNTNEIDAKGLFVIRSDDTEVRVFCCECTHNPFFGNNVTYVCHGSPFNKSGDVTNGPASKSLIEYNATLGDDIITITEQSFKRHDNNISPRIES